MKLLQPHAPSRLVALALLVIGVTACRGDGPTESGPRPGLHAIGGDGVTDTAYATLAAPLVVELRDADGAPIAGAPIRFTFLGDPQRNHENLVTAIADRPPWDPYGRTVETETDDKGRASIALRFLRLAGIGLVEFSAPSLGFVDTATYTVLPGKATSIAPGQDTALTHSSSVQLGIQTMDVNGNRRNDAATYSTTSPVLSVTTSGLLRAVDYGQGRVVVETSGLRDSITVVVVPSGTLALTHEAYSTGDPCGIALMNTDLTGRRTLAGARVGFYCPHEPNWGPSGDRIIFTMWDSYYETYLVTTDLNGVVTKLIAPPLPFNGYWGGEYSADGQWIYFSVRTDHQNSEIWRMRPNPTSAQRIGATADWYDSDMRASPSPNGARLVYWTNRGPDRIRIMDVATGASIPFAVTGQWPRWSPMSDQIAWVDEADQLWVKNVDGSGGRRLGSTDGFYAGSLDWSPDGQWLAVRGSVGIELIHVPTNLVLPLPNTWEYTQPAWRPVPPSSD